MDLIFYTLGLFSLLLIIVGVVDYIIGRNIGEVYPLWKFEGKAKRKYNGNI